MNNKVIQISEDIGSEMLDLVEKHAITNKQHRALLLGRESDDVIIFDTFCPLDNAKKELNYEGRYGLLLYSFFQNDEAKKASEEYLNKTREYPDKLLMGLVNFDHLSIYGLSLDRNLKILDFTVGKESEKVA